MKRHKKKVRPIPNLLKNSPNKVSNNTISRDRISIPFYFPYLDKYKINDPSFKNKKLLLRTSESTLTLENYEIIYANDILQKINKNYLKDITDFFRDQPSLHILTILDTLTKPISELYITNFEFKTEMEKNLLKFIICKDNRLRLDTTLDEKFDHLSEALSKKKYLASFIILYRASLKDPNRKENLLFLLKWLFHFYGRIFEILIVEEDADKKFSIPNEFAHHPIKHHFLYNPDNFNRGWGYNCTAKHLTTNDVLVLADADILLNNSFLGCVLDIYNNRYSIMSPYKNIYYSSFQEKKNIINTLSFRKLNYTENSLQHSVTITGGLIIVNRQTFLNLGGFEQYFSYGCEDRALDVTYLVSLGKDKIKVNDDIYIHLFHGTSKGDESKRKLVKHHLMKNYRCGIKLNTGMYKNLHGRCKHAPYSKIKNMISHRRKHMGLLNLYKTSLKRHVNTIPPYP